MTDGVFRSQGMWQVILTRAYIDTDPIVVGTCCYKVVVYLVSS